MVIRYFDTQRVLSADEVELICDFLYTELGQYGDPKELIVKAIDYAMRDSVYGGVVALAHQNEKLVGVVVVNKTGMEGYIPENLLVYIAIDKDHRGQGLGKELLTSVLNHVGGDVALHVEPDNPALHLYQKLGFINKYLEMRFTGKRE